jgi:hypothetical protein
MKSTQIFQRIYLILKWSVASLCSLLVLYAISLKLVVSICCFTAMVILLLPPLSERINRFIPILKSKGMKGFVLVFLLVAGAMQLPKQPKSEIKQVTNSNTNNQDIPQQITKKIDTLRKEKPVENDTLKMIEQEEAKWVQKAAEIKDLKEKFEEHCMNSWDGSCIPLLVYTKNLMNDPESFEHVETRYRIEGNYAIVVMSYRGKNAYGGTVQNYIKAKVNLNCEVVEVLEN